MGIESALRPASRARTPSAFKTAQRVAAEARCRFPQMSLYSVATPWMRHSSSSVDESLCSFFIRHDAVMYSGNGATGEPFDFGPLQEQGLCSQSPHVLLEASYRLMEILTDAGMFRSRGPAAPQPPLTNSGVVLAKASPDRFHTLHRVARKMRPDPRVAHELLHPGGHLRAPAPPWMSRLSRVTR